MKLKLSKTKAAASLSLSFAYAFLIFLFIPFDTYLHNPMSFVIGWDVMLLQLAVLMLVGFAMFSFVFLLLFHHTNRWVARGSLLLLLAIHIAFAVLTTIQFSPGLMFLILFLDSAAVLWLLMDKLFADKAVDAAVHLIWGSLLAGYIQILFLNGNMPAITGEDTVFKVSSFYIVINALVWIAITLLPMVIWLILRKAKIKYNYERALISSMLIILGMQTAGLINASMSNRLPEGFDAKPQYLSYSTIMNLSAENNVIVFLLEHLDVLLMEEMLDRYPEIAAQLDGFTLYKNNVSEYNVTYPSVIKMLTQYEYSGGFIDMAEYMDAAWSQHSYIDTLKENGFTVNMLIDSSTTYSHFGQLLSKADNIRTADSVRYLPVNTAIYMGSISLGKFAPYIVKDSFMQMMHPGIGNEFYEFVYQPPGSAQPSVVGAQSDLAFYNYIKTNIMDASSEQNVFSFIHLNSAHPSNSLRYDAAMGTIVRGGSRIDSKRANFEILNVYFDNMKSSGVYDNSTVIIIGDHGIPFSIHNNNPAVTTGLLIKPPNSTGALQTDTHSELSHANFSASILEAAGIYINNSGLSYFDVINAGIPQTRYFRLTVEAWQAGGVYEITGYAGDFNNWRLIK